MPQCRAADRAARDEMTTDTESGSPAAHEPSATRHVLPRPGARSGHGGRGRPDHRAGTARRARGRACRTLRWFVLLPLFALAEVVVIHLPTQRNAHGHTLREIPAVLGLTFLVPQQYVTAYVVGSVLALVLAARMRGVKLAFNAPCSPSRRRSGALTYHAILQGGDPLSPHRVAGRPGSGARHRPDLRSGRDRGHQPDRGRPRRRGAARGAAVGLGRGVHQHLRRTARGDARAGPALGPAAAGRRRGPAGPGLPRLHHAGPRTRADPPALPVRRPHLLSALLWRRSSRSSPRRGSRPDARRACLPRGGRRRPPRALPRRRETACCTPSPATCRSPPWWWAARDAGVVQHQPPRRRTS